MGHPKSQVGATCHLYRRLRGGICLSIAILSFIDRSPHRRLSALEILDHDSVPVKR
ncbi:uncharacterized protein BCR38DRAFT_428576 [Pseudomassariella vexata]|uniref:Uncharacterized protein n=1 Tax=Pseudomassariella vexata TaxID=1141098 RepID=A0A1Y2E2X3_9PEZI|nr:uncharacterized protein BCR38DRAFT_428576 [Pseudomassariella vexata]ORY65859.1 hypothetical protein BCR38DRAFT_428576 [Pseudomassariella vexata]